jgi:hypothetical protein
VSSDVALSRRNPLLSNAIALTTKFAPNNTEKAMILGMLALKQQQRLDNGPLGDASRRYTRCQANRVDEADGCQANRDATTNGCQADVEVRLHTALLSCVVDDVEAADAVANVFIDGGM